MKLSAEGLPVFRMIHNVRPFPVEPEELVGTVLGGVAYSQCVGVEWDALPGDPRAVHPSFLAIFRENPRATAHGDARPSASEQGPDEPQSPQK